MRFLFSTAIAILLIVNTDGLSAMQPNALISRLKPILGSPSENIETLNNGQFGELSWNITDSAWVAINLEKSYSRIFLSWNNPGYSWSDSIASTQFPQNLQIPLDYCILFSSNSTDGVDGTWETAVSVSGNDVTARSHTIDIKSSQWIKMKISKGNGVIDEIEIFDLSGGGEDQWFFTGTSISANAFKAFVPKVCFADLVTKSDSTFTPAVVRGAIPGIKSADMARDISKYLDMSRNVKHWAVEMGTNDAWNGDTANLSSFKINMQLIIDSCKANNIDVIIASVIATDSLKANWQVSSAFLAAIDELTTQNRLSPGPDFYSWFRAHPDQLTSDGVHPNETGCASIQKLWAEKLFTIYKLPTPAQKYKSVTNVNRVLLSDGFSGGKVRMKILQPGTLSVFKANGILVDKVNFTYPSLYILKSRGGFYILKHVSNFGNEQICVHNY